MCFSYDIINSGSMSLHLITGSPLLYVFLSPMHLSLATQCSQASNSFLLTSHSLFLAATVFTLFWWSSVVFFPLSPLVRTSKQALEWCSANDCLWLATCGRIACWQSRPIRRRSTLTLYWSKWDVHLARQSFHEARSNMLSLKQKPGICWWLIRLKCC